MTTAMDSNQAGYGVASGVAAHDRLEISQQRVRPPGLLAELTELDSAVAAMEHSIELMEGRTVTIRHMEPEPEVAGPSGPRPPTSRSGIADRVFDAHQRLRLLAHRLDACRKAIDLPEGEGEEPF